MASVVEHADDIIVSSTTDGIITSWNPAAEQRTGYSAAEAIGQPGTIMLSPDRQPDVPLLLERLRRGETVRGYETVAQRKDGTTFDAWVTLAPLREADGRTTGISLVARDISERKQAESAKAALIRKLEAALTR